MGKMPFPLFLLRDTPACLLSSSTLFSLGFIFGQNLDELILHFKTWSFWVLVAFLTLLGSWGVIYYVKNKKMC
jgi:membrane protein DedA with SNARE-associated domain